MDRQRIKDRHRIKLFFFFILVVGIFIDVVPANSMTLNEAAKLVAPDGAEGDDFGYSVSVSGDTAVVGARSDDDNGSGAGSVYVFIRSGDLWTLQTKLTAFDGAVNNSFGDSVSVFDDTIVVGALLDDDNGFASGSVYVQTYRSR